MSYKERHILWHSLSSTQRHCVVDCVFTMLCNWQCNHRQWRRRGLQRT